MSQSESERITIVSGLPRSGTSMMMRMVDAGGIPALTDNIREADEDNPRGYYEFEPVKKTKEDPSWLERAPGRCVKMVYRLLYDLPADREYYVVFMRRNLDEVIRSQDVMLERRGRSANEMEPEKLRGLFEVQLAEFDQWVRQQKNFKIIYVNYNDIVADARPTVDRILEFLGDGLDRSAMLAAVEPKLYRQRT